MIIIFIYESKFEVPMGWEKGGKEGRKELLINPKDSALRKVNAGTEIVGIEENGHWYVWGFIFRLLLVRHWQIPCFVTSCFLMLVERRSFMRLSFLAQRKY